MPYIDPKSRELFDEHIEHLSAMIDTPGELNYIITKLIHDHLHYTGPSYTSINEVIGVLECAKMEMYRTIIAGYEDLKRRENGPVSKLDKEKVR